MFFFLFKYIISSDNLVDLDFQAGDPSLVPSFKAAKSRANNHFLAAWWRAAFTPTIEVTTRVDTRQAAGLSISYIMRDADDDRPSGRHIIHQDQKIFGRCCNT